MILIKFDILLRIKNRLFVLQKSAPKGTARPLPHKPEGPVNAILFACLSRRIPIYCKRKPKKEALYALHKKRFGRSDLGRRK